MHAMNRMFNSKVDTKGEMIVSQRLFLTNQASYLLHGIKTFSTYPRLLANDSVEIPLTNLTESAEASSNIDSMSDAPDRFPRAAALLWRTLEEWIVDHYVTQYNQQLDEWMNAHTRR